MINKNKLNKIFLSGILFVTLLVSSIFSQSDPNVYKKNVHYKPQLEMIKLSKIKQADIVMLGNSLTHGANWNELLGRFSVVEHGIVGDVIKGMAARIQYVYKLNPKIVFILGGTNDIYNWTPIDEIFSDYVKIIEGLKARKIIPVIQLAPYAGKIWGTEYLAANEPNIKPEDYNAGRNKVIDQLNSKLRTYANQNNIDLIDLNKKTKRGNFLKSEITRDGIHFNAKGYKIWAPEVDKVLKKYDL